MSDWSKTALYTAIGLVAAGFALIALAWNGAAGRDFLAGQFPYLLSGGIGGAALIACGLTIVRVHASRRDSMVIAQKLDDLLVALGREAQAEQTILSAVPDSADIVLAGRGSYHLPSCRLVEGRSDYRPVPAAEAEAEGLTACRICKPTAATA
jgi:hypothetical protein